MRKQVEEIGGDRRGRRAAAVERDRKGRFSARRKRATVLRLLRGDPTIGTTKRSDDGF